MNFRIGGFEGYENVFYCETQIYLFFYIHSAP